LPKIPFLLLGAGMGTSAWRMRKRAIAAKTVTETKAAPAREDLDAMMRIEPLAVEVGLGLVRLVKREETLRYCAESRASGGSWRATSGMCSRRYVSPTIFRCGRANSDFA